MAKSKPCSSARTAARSRSAGRASANPAASGTRSSEEAVAAGIAASRNRSAGRAFPLEGLTGEARLEARIVTGLGELDRVTGGGFCRGLGGADRRRAGHRQVHLLIQACGLARPQGRARRLYLGGGIDFGRSACAPPGSASATPMSSLPPRPASRISSPLWASGDRPKPRGDRFDPDHMERCDRIDARHRIAGARLGPGADPLRQGERRRDHPGRAMSPRTARSPAHASSNIWSMR